MLFSIFRQVKSNISYIHDQNFAHWGEEEEEEEEEEEKKKKKKKKREKRRR